MTSFGLDQYYLNPLVHSDDDDSMDQITPDTSLNSSRKMWPDKHEPLFVLPLSPGLNQDYHICMAEKGQSLWAKLVDSNTVVKDNLVFQGGISQLDVKTLLNQFCQRVCRRPVTKEDILYTTIRHGPAQFSATVKLSCIGGGEFRGGVCSTQRAAQKSAAQQAVQAHKALISMLCFTNRPKVGQQEHCESNESNSSSSHSDGVDTCLNLEKEFPHEPVANPTMTGKSVLNVACMRIVRRALRKGDIVFEGSMHATAPVPEYRCAVKLPCLPGVWGSKVWFGKVCSSQKAAEQCAAAVAVESIFDDPELGPLASSSSKQKYPKACGQENNRSTVRAGNLRNLKANSFTHHSPYTQHANIFYDGLCDSSQVQCGQNLEFVITL